MSTHAPPWYPVRATGFGRRDWAVQGHHHTCEILCDYNSSDVHAREACGHCRCDCDGSCNVAVAGGLTEEEAKHICTLSDMTEVERYLLSLSGRFQWIGGMLISLLEHPDHPNAETRSRKDATHASPS